MVTCTSRPPSRRNKSASGRPVGAIFFRKRWTGARTRRWCRCLLQEVGRIFGCEVTFGSWGTSVFSRGGRFCDLKTAIAGTLWRWWRLIFRCLRVQKGAQRPAGGTAALLAVRSKQRRPQICEKSPSAPAMTSQRRMTSSRLRPSLHSQRCFCFAFLFVINVVALFQILNRTDPIAF